MSRIRNNSKNDDNRQDFGHTKDGNHLMNRRNQKVLSAYQNAERRLIAYMLQNAHVAERVKNRLGSKFNLEQHQIIVTYLYGFYEEGNEPNSSHFLTYIEDETIRKLIVELSMLDCSWEITDKEMDDYIRTILAEQTDHVRIKQLEQEQKLLEKTDPVKAAQIAMEILKIKQQSKNGASF